METMTQLNQVDVMSPNDWTALSERDQSRILRDSNWIAEEKIDGCRAKLHCTDDGLRVDGRRHSGPGEYYEHPEWLPDGVIYGVAPIGTVLDAEYYQGGFIVFDVIRWAGRSMEAVSFSDRRRLLERLFAGRADELAGVGIRLIEQHTDKKWFMAEVLARGGEGIVLKRLDAGYIEGCDSAAVLRWKRENTIDGWISGRNDGPVGSWEISCYDSHGQVVPVAAVVIAVGWKPELGRVVEVRGNGWTKNGRIRHAAFERWRDDKDQADCKIGGRENAG